MSKLEVKNLQQQYLYGTTGVNNLSFLAENSSYVVLGGEESGKTSLFRVLSGKEKPFRGEVLYNGVSLDKIPIRERKIVFVRERGGIFPLRSVEYNLAYPLKIRNFDKNDIAECVDRALNLSDLAKLRYKRAGSLNKFETAKLKLARCFLREAEFYFVDEVQKGLSPCEREELTENLLNKIKELRGVKVFASDDFREAKQLSEEGCVLYYGITEQTGLLDVFYDKPTTPEVFRLTHGEPTVEEGMYDKSAGIVTLKDKKIIVHREEKENEIEITSVIVLTAKDGFTKIYNAVDEKLIDFD